MTGGVFEADKKQAEIAELKTRLAKEEVWSNHKLSAELNSALTSAEKELEDWLTFKSKLADLKSLVEIAEDEDDEGMLRELETEFNKLSSKLDELEIEMMFTGETDNNNAFLNIHPGAGGTESQDWAEMLLRMYQRWAEKHNFQVDIVNLEPGEVAGIKDAILFIKGHRAYGYLSAESGVHRLVRLSPFNANNKRQTSFCAVRVTPEVDDNIEIEIDEKDIRIDTFRASGAGGQHVNKTSSAVRITHLPTGIAVSCQNERSQFQNRDMAFRILRSRLYDFELAKKEEETAKSQKDRKAIEWGNQIRSYVFQPYTMAKDHRTNIEKGNINAVMDGEIDEFIIGYLKNKNSKVS
jgi:peptide chain release factor 2